MFVAQTAKPVNMEYVRLSVRLLCTFQYTEYENFLERELTQGDNEINAWRRGFFLSFDVRVRRDVI